jgi:hypothetical protein
MQAVYCLKGRLVSCLDFEQYRMACGAVDADLLHKPGQEWNTIMIDYEADSDWLTQFTDQGLWP